MVPSIRLLMAVKMSNGQTCLIALIDMVLSLYSTIPTRIVATPTRLTILPFQLSMHPLSPATITTLRSRQPPLFRHRHSQLSPDGRVTTKIKAQIPNPGLITHQLPLHHRHHQIGTHLTHSHPMERQVGVVIVVVALNMAIVQHSTLKTGIVWNTEQLSTCDSQLNRYDP